MEWDGRQYLTAGDRSKLTMVYGYACQRQGPVCRCSFHVLVVFFRRRLVLQCNVFINVCCSPGISGMLVVYLNIVLFLTVPVISQCDRGFALQVVLLDCIELHINVNELLRASKLNLYAPHV